MAANTSARPQMIMGGVVGLRPAAPRDAEDLVRLSWDLDTHLIASPIPHVPRSAEAIRRGLEKALEGEPDPNKDIILVATGPGDDASFLGAALIWGIDVHNRFAHLGITLVPGARKRGYGSRIVKALCEYGFRMRNLRRLELETSATNAAMRRTAVACGFTEEGRMRQRHYDGDGYVDVVIFGLLRSEWLAASGAAVAYERIRPTGPPVPEGGDGGREPTGDLQDSPPGALSRRPSPFQW